MKTHPIAAVLLLLHMFLLVPLTHAGPTGPVTWGDTVAIGGGWGRMARMANGDWVCVTTRYPSGSESFLRLWRSTDNARSWTQLADVAEVGRTLDNGEVVALPDGTLLLSMRSLIEGLSYRLPVYASTDGGANWSFLSHIDSSENMGSKGLWEPDFRVLDDGTLVVTYSNEKHPGYSQLISLKISDDNGETWGDEQWAVTQPGGGILRPGMSQMERMANGEYILVYEVVNSGNADVFYKISGDGVTWPDGIGTRIPLQHAGPFIASLPNGVLLVTSCENEVSYSEDFARSWQKIEPPAWDVGHLFTWPAIYVTGPDEIAVMVVNDGVHMRFGTLSPRPPWPDLWSDNFADGDLTGWARYGGNFEVADGCAFLSNESSNGKAMTGDNFWRDGLLEADVMLTTAGNAGLMFRTTDPDRVGADGAFGYFAGLDTAGSVFLGRMANSYTPLGSAAVTVGTNTWHHLAVVFEGNEIRIHVDHSPGPNLVCTDSQFERGQIGIRSYSCDARFDNLSFRNFHPMRLGIQSQGDQLQFTWPETAVSVKLHSSDIPGAAGIAIPMLPAHADGEATLEIDRPSAPRRFYWLQAE